MSQSTETRLHDMVERLDALDWAKIQFMLICCFGRFRAGVAAYILPTSVIVVIVIISLAPRLTSVFLVMELMFKATRSS